jgi:hypothetical protein
VVGWPVTGTPEKVCAVSPSLMTAAGCDKIT